MLVNNSGSSYLTDGRFTHTDSSLLTTPSPTSFWTAIFTAKFSSGGKKTNTRFWGLPQQEIHTVVDPTCSWVESSSKLVSVVSKNPLHLKRDDKKPRISSVCSERNNRTPPSPGKEKQHSPPCTQPQNTKKKKNNEQPITAPTSPCTHRRILQNNKSFFHIKEK